MADFRRILVAGGAGFIGSNYVRYALQHHPDWEIMVFDKLTYAASPDTLADVNDRHTFVQGDVTDSDQVAEVISGVDAVVNFAAETHVDRSLMDPRPFVRTNVEGALVLLEQARRADVKRFLQVSTDEVYGDVTGTDRHSVEADALAPRSPYAATKAAAEHLALSYVASHKLDVVVTRGSNTYGPYQHPEKIIPFFATNALEGRSLPVYGNGSAVRDYMHVEDHCSGIDLVLHKGNSGEAYNLGARSEVRGLHVAETVLGLLAKPLDLIRFVADRPGHDYRYSVDPSKAEVLGWTRIWDFEDGLARTVGWYAENTQWWGPIKHGAGFREYEQRWYAPVPAKSGA